MSNLTPAARNTEPSPWLTKPTTTLVALLLAVRESGRLPASDRRKRVSVSEIRAELRRREARGFDDPFDSPYPDVTW